MPRAGLGDTAEGWQGRGAGSHWWLLSSTMQGFGAGAGGSGIEVGLRKQTELNQKGQVLCVTGFNSFFSSKTVFSQCFKPRKMITWDGFKA